MRIRKNDALALLHQSMRLGDRVLLVLSVMAGFGFDRPDALIPEGEMWGAAKEALPPGAILDEMQPKPRGEVLLAGSAHAPGGRPVERLEVRLGAGSVDKRLYVMGPRVWDRKMGFVDAVTRPEPFTSVPLTWEYAFGGKGSEANPAGRGLVDKSVPQPVRLPRIEDPDHLIASPTDRPEPAGFGPWPLTHPGRLRIAGTYDENWLRDAWPWLPRDHAPEFFCMAPPDQRLNGYWSGDEPIVLRHLHPSRPDLRFALAAPRLRAFVRRESGEEFEEAVGHLDTLWLFPDREIGVLIWRATVPVRDAAMSDVAGLLLDVEPRESRPLNPEHYLSLYAGGEFAPAEAAPEPAPVPDPPVEEPTPELPPDPALAALVGQASALEAEFQGELDAALADMGLDAEALMTPVPGAFADPVGLPDVAPDVAGMALRAAEIEQENLAALRAMGIDPDVPAETLGESPRPVPDPRELAAQLDAMGVLDADAKQYLLEAADLQDGIPDLADRLAALPVPAPTPAPEEAAPVPPAPRLDSREAVLGFLAEGRSLAGHDLSDLDLTGLDLSGRDLRETVLENADLTGASLAGADLSGAVLTGAGLEGAACSGTRFIGAHMGGVRAREAVFRGADLREADLTDASLPGADLQESRLDDTLFDRADLSGAALGRAGGRRVSFVEAGLAGASFPEADLAFADFSASRLDNTDFRRARLGSAAFFGAAGQGVVFQEAFLAKARADEATALPGVDCRGADLARSNWAGARMTGGDFSEADLERAEFTGAGLGEGNFHRARGRFARFREADLSSARMVGANLFQGDLAGARLTAADFTGANLYEAEFHQAVVDGTVFTEANLNRTKLASWRPS